MKTFKGDNLSLIYYEMLEDGYYSPYQFTESRVGQMKDLGPTYFEITDDDFRFPFLNKRAINPFFALAEFSWIITGSNEVSPLKFFIESYDAYSDDGKTLNGAYGYRLRNFFGLDQIENAIECLKKDPDSRRIVLNMWSADDLTAVSKDFPCNISVILKIRDGKLDLTVLNRSNDLFLGVPYNVFVFYLLQVYIAKRVECGIGVQRHFTNCLHIYKRDMDKIAEVLAANNKTTLKAIPKIIPPFKSSSYVDYEHNKINQQKYDELTNDGISDFFKSYVTLKSTRNFDSAIKLLPHNLLGYVAYLWYSEKRDFSANENYFSKFKWEANMGFDVQRLYTLKYESEDTIKKFMEDGSKSLIDQYDKFLEVIQAKSGIYSIREGVNRNTIIQTVLLSFVMASVASNMAPDTKALFTEKVERVAQDLEINFDDIIYFTRYESKFLEILQS